MKTFTDSAGRVWTVAINVDAIKRVQSLVQVNLLEAIEGKLLERLSTDMVLLCDILFALVKPEADAKNVSDQDFGRAMAGDVLDAASTALLEELVDFFPSGKRRLLSQALAKLQKLEALAIDVTRRKLDSDDLERQLLTELETALAAPGGSSGNSPASSASTPGD